MCHDDDVLLTSVFFCTDLELQVVSSLRGVVNTPLHVRGRGHDALVMDLLTFVGLLKFSVGNSRVMSAL